MVVSTREVYSEREWAQSPIHLQVFPDVLDEILEASPCGPGMDLRLLVARSEGQPFSDLDLVVGDDGQGGHDPFGAERAALHHLLDDRLHGGQGPG